MAHWSSFIKTIFSYVLKIVPTKGERISRVPPFSLKRAMRSPLVGTIYEAYAKMVLINNHQCAIADIVLGVWLKVKKLNQPIIYVQKYRKKRNYLYGNLTHKITSLQIQLQRV